MVASDKTGTLTENRLRLADALPANGRDERELLAAAVLASTARLLDEEGQLRPVGDPVDAALALAAHERGLTRTVLLEGRRLGARAARSIRCASGWLVVYEEGDGSSPVRQGSTRGRARALDRAGRRIRVDRGGRGGMGVERAQGARRREARAPRRVRGGRRSRASGSPSSGSSRCTIRCADSAHNAVEEARSAGLRVEMMTGDHPLTARGDRPRCSTCPSPRSTRV